MEDKWISVNSRLPEDCQTVLIYTKYSTIFMALHVNNNEYIWGATMEWEESEVTYWQPLPEPPKEL